MVAKSRLYLLIIISAAILAPTLFFILRTFYSTQTEIKIGPVGREIAAQEEIMPKQDKLSYDIDKMKSKTGDLTGGRISVGENLSKDEADKERLRKIEINRNILMRQLDKNIADAKAALASNPDDKNAKGMLIMSELMKKSMIEHERSQKDLPTSR